MLAHRPAPGTRLPGLFRQGGAVLRSTAALACSKGGPAGSRCFRVTPESFTCWNLSQAPVEVGGWYSSPSRCWSGICTAGVHNDAVHTPSAGRHRSCRDSDATGPPDAAFIITGGADPIDVARTIANTGARAVEGGSRRRAVHDAARTRHRRWTGLAMNATSDNDRYTCRPSAASAPDHDGAGHMAFNTFVPDAGRVLAGPARAAGFARRRRPSR